MNAVSKDAVAQLPLSEKETYLKTRKKTGWTVFMSWFINDLKAYDYGEIRDIVVKENLRGELKCNFIADPFLFFHLPSCSHATHTSADN